MGQLLLDEINNCVKDDFKEWNKQVPEEPDFNELDVVQQSMTLLII